METKKQKETEEINIIESAKENKKTIIGAVVAIVVIALIAVGISWYFQNKSAKLAEIEAVADLSTFDQFNDSIVLTNYLNAANAGSDRAALEAAIKYYNDGNYDAALALLNKSSVKSEIIEAGRYSLIGDCYVNLEKYDDAVKAYNNAIKASDNNPQIAPFELIKLANVYRAQGNYAEELKAYERIINEYPEYTSNLANQRPPVDLRKYVERAKTAAGK